MKKSSKSNWCSNLRHAQKAWGFLSPAKKIALKQLTERYAVSVAAGDLQFIDGRWYITHSGLMALAERRRCSGIRTAIQVRLSNPETSRWIFKAIVYKTQNSRGFVGFGDADPSNVSSMVHGAEMRVAETRAVNRALRKAYGIGICSVEELGAFSASSRSSAPPPSNGSGFSSSNGAGKNQPRLRDQLCLLIRQFKLDPNLVKSYAADFCEAAAIGDASRERVEAFISHLAVLAKENRDALVCKLNSYAHPAEVRS